jgi:pimeloyl-ACP methyl ester carboxylesterase
MRLIYLHGFASSPHSRKAQAFRAALSAKDCAVEVPDLDEVDFERLTISGQLSVVERTILDRAAPSFKLRHDVRLTGSSMGGYLAALYAASHQEVSRLVLLAPAFDFAQRWDERWPEDSSGSKARAIGVFHFRDQQVRTIGYGLIEDARSYPAFPSFTQPALIFHGVNDDVVPIENSRAFVAAHPNARLIELRSGHELLDVLEPIVEEAVEFLTGS